MKTKYSFSLFTKINKNSFLLGRVLKSKNLCTFGINICKVLYPNATSSVAKNQFYFISVPFVLLMADFDNEKSIVKNI